MGERIEKTLDVVACRANVIAGRDHLLAPGLFGRPLPGLDGRRCHAGVVQNAVTARRIRRYREVLGRYRFTGCVEQPNLAESSLGRDDVIAFEAEMLQRSYDLRERHPEHPAGGAGQCRIDDRHAARTQAVVTCDRRRIHRCNAAMAEFVCEFPGRLRRIQKDPATRFQARGNLGADERRVEHDNVIGLIDQVAVGDWLVGIAAECLHRGPGSFCCVEAKCLY